MGRRKGKHTRRQEIAKKSRLNGGRFGTACAVEKEQEVNEIIYDENDDDEEVEDDNWIDDVVIGEI